MSLFGFPIMCLSLLQIQTLRTLQSRHGLQSPQAVRKSHERASWLESRNFLPYVRFVGRTNMYYVVALQVHQQHSPFPTFLTLKPDTLPSTLLYPSHLVTMFKAISNKVTIHLSRALCLPKPASRTLSSSPTAMKTSPSSSCSSTSSSTIQRQAPTNAMTDPANTYTSTDAATFSRLGASMTALPPDEEYPQNQALTHLTTLKCERLGAVVESVDGFAGREVYTAEHAAEFMRRGACMVVWPDSEGEDGDEGMEGGEVENGKDGKRR